MCHNKHLLNTKRVDECNKVTNNVMAAVAGDRTRGFSVTIATKIRSNGTVSEWAQGKNLAAPCVPKFREAMEEEYNGAFSFLCYVHSYAVNSHHSMLYLLHFWFLLQLRSSLCVTYGYFGLFTQSMCLAFQDRSPLAVALKFIENKCSWDLTLRFTITSSYREGNKTEQ